MAQKMEIVGIEWEWLLSQTCFTPDTRWNSYSVRVRNYATPYSGCFPYTTKGDKCIHLLI